MKEIPAVSVIIPMYNAEKYIGECLDSVLAQTFQNFEVIVVDDCSTDLSVAIVESYAEKFDGRLKLIKTKKNCGNPGIPRNIGLNFSRGEYVYFMDNDDMIVTSALEEMYNIATKFKTDIVYMHRCFTKLETDTSAEKLKFTSFLKEDFLSDPIPVTGDISKRMDLLLSGHFRVMPWLKFLRRDFLVIEGITFPHIKVSEDDFWTIELLLRAETILSVPNAIYINRDNPKSLTRKKKSVTELVKYHMTPLFDGEKNFFKITNAYDFFHDNPRYVYAWIEKVARYCFQKIFPACAELKSHEVYEIFFQNFSSDNNERNLLRAYLCTLVNVQQKQLLFAQRKFNEFNQFAAAAQKRIAELENEIRQLKSKE
ncbi:MAG: glycosyltransferase [Selenomonadaceae bacterium]|nr:glycosyltransferase [Selenomonadaceae bacterium]